MNKNRFKLDKWTEEYIPDLIRHADDPEVAYNLRNIFPNPYTEEDARGWIEICSNADEYNNYNRAIVIEGEAVGGIGLIRGTDVYCKTAEIGYWLGRAFWGRGVMSAAVEEICDYGFKNLDVVRIYAGAFARNAGSRRVLEKNGFVLEGIHKMNVYKNGEYDDSCMYALVRSDI